MALFHAVMIFSDATSCVFNHIFKCKKKENTEQDYFVGQVCVCVCVCMCLLFFFIAKSCERIFSD